jgi:hypothetical protein
MIKGALNSTGFLTLTIGDKNADGSFSQVKDSDEASRRINNLNRRVLADLFERAIVVTERHKSGAIHFHILGVLSGRPDIRTGVNFEAIKRRDYRTAPAALRKLWEKLRDVLPGYGFGRHELMPVYKNGQAVASYVAKYIEKNVCNRLKEDAHKKLVRYIGWEKRQLKPNEFGWATPRAVAWRGKARQRAALANIFEPEQAYEAMGHSWAFQLSTLWQCLTEDDCLPFLKMDWQTTEIARATLFKVASGHMRRADAQKSPFGEAIRDIKSTWPGYFRPVAMAV